MKIYLFSFLIMGLSVCCLSQSVSLFKNDFVSLKKLDVKKPSVYVDFDRAVLAPELCSLKDVTTRKDQALYRLKLYNNTTAPINVDALSGAFDPISGEDMPLTTTKGTNETFRALPKGGRVRLCYQAESIITYESRQGKSGGLETEIPVETQVPQIDFHCSCKSIMSDVRSFNSPGLWIPSGSYVVFDVPQKYLSKNLKIFTLFNYEWEFERTNLSDGEPHHQVYFYSSNIP